MDNVAIIEFTCSHQECLYSQILFLKSQYNVFLVCHPKMRTTVNGFVEDDKVFTFDWENDFWLKSLRDFIKKNNIKKVIFNTATNKVVLRMTWLMLFSGVKFYGTLHNVFKLEHSGTQKLISLRIQKYFVLADYLKNQQSVSAQKKLEVFYPIYFQNYQDVAISKPENEFWIVIPGGMELKRRNYLGLIDEMQKCRPHTNIKFIILGRTVKENQDYKLFSEALQKENLLDHFVFFEEFIPNDVYYTYLKRADLILPLIKTDVTSKRFNYTAHQVSGTFNLSFGFAVPMMMETFYQQYEPFRSNSLFYQPGALISNMNQLVDNPATCQQVSTAIKNFEGFKYELQEKRYLKAVE